MTISNSIPKWNSGKLGEKKRIVNPFFHDSIFPNPGV